MTKKIRDELASGATLESVAKKRGVHIATIWAIKKGESWK